jgi:hypothetical protein
MTRKTGPETAQIGGYFSPSNPVTYMAVCPHSPSKSADMTGVLLRKKGLGPYSA